MGSIFYMRRSGQKYAYESTSVRVPGRKNPITIKTYLGKVDPETSKIILKETRSTPKEEYAKLYGSVKFLDEIQKGLGIFNDLNPFSPRWHPISWVPPWYWPSIQPHSILYIIRSKVP